MVQWRGAGQVHLLTREDAPRAVSQHGALVIEQDPPKPRSAQQKHAVGRQGHVRPGPGGASCGGREQAGAGSRGGQGGSFTM